MLRAGQAVYEHIMAHWPEAQHWLVLCGHGNNGGDGYVVARLAQAAGKQVTLLACDGSKPLPDEARTARDGWLESGGEIHAPDAAWPENVDVIVDALLGTGVSRAPVEPLSTLIAQINQHSAPVVAIDMPSGLSAENGMTPGEATEATHTVSVIALKPGQLTGKARDCVGQLYFAGLGLRLSDSTAAPMARYDAHSLRQWLKPRKATSHKGDQGRLLIIGGDSGTTGAIRMSAEAALRTGSGLVRVLTHKDNIAPILTARPEVMVDELTDTRLDDGIAWADVIAIGPGLGQREWGQNALEKVKKALKSRCFGMLMRLTCWQ